MWYYSEDIELLHKIKDLNPRNFLFWGNNMSKKGKLYKRTKYLLIKELGTNHIKAILDGGFTANKLYIKTFNEELELRSKEGLFNINRLERWLRKVFYYWLY